MPAQRPSLVIAVGPSTDQPAEHTDSDKTLVSSPPFTSGSGHFDSHRTALKQASDLGTPSQKRTPQRRTASFIHDRNDSPPPPADAESVSSLESDGKTQFRGLPARVVLTVSFALYLSIMVTGVIVMSAVGASIVLEGDRGNALTAAISSTRLGEAAVSNLRNMVTQTTLSASTSIAGTSLGTSLSNALAAIQLTTQFTSSAQLNIVSRCMSVADVAFGACTMLAGSSVTVISADATRVFHDTVASYPLNTTLATLSHRQLVVSNSTSSLSIDAAVIVTLPVEVASRPGESQTLAASTTFTPQTAVKALAAVDDFGFFTGTGPTAKDASTPNATWVGTIQGATAMNVAASGVWFDRRSSVLRHVIVQSLTSGDGQRVNLITSSSVDMAVVTQLQGLPAFSRVCLFTTANGGTSLGCKVGGDADEISASVIPETPTALEGRLRAMFQAAQVEQTTHQPTAIQPRYVYIDKYETALLGVGAAHVVALTPFMPAGVVNLDGTSELSNMWFAAIITKPESVSFKYNVFSQLGLACLALFLFASTVFYVLVYLLYVRHIRDLTKRITEVSDLNFTAIPDDDGLDGIESQSDSTSEAGSGTGKSQRNDELRCHAVLRDIRQLYGEFFKVANALRAVVPFLPTSFVKKSSSKFLKKASKSAARHPNAAASPCGSPLAPGQSNPDDKQHPHRVSLPDFGMDMSSEGSNTDDDDERDIDPNRESHLSSISDVDLEASGNANNQSFEISTGDMTGSGSGSMARGMHRIASASASGTNPVTNRQTVSANPQQSPTDKRAKALPTPPKHHSGHHHHNTSRHGSHLPAQPNHRKHFTNETVTAPAAIATFQLYVRQKARSNRQVVVEAQKEFFVAASMQITQYRGAIVHMTPFSIVAEWASHESALRACTAAVETCKSAIPKPAAGKEEQFRIGVGIDHGIIVRGVMGTQAKKVMICDGSVVQRSAILASVAVRNHANVVISESCRTAVDLFVESRPVDVLAMPRSVRVTKATDLETVHQCLRVNTGDEAGDEEWMYALERKDLRESKVVAGDDPYIRGFTAWCAGELSHAKGNWQQCVEAPDGTLDAFLKRKLDFLKDVDATTGPIPDLAASAMNNDDDLDELELGPSASKSRIIGTYRKVSTHSSATARSSSGMTSRTASMLEGSATAQPLVAASSVRNDVANFFKGVKAGKRPYFRATAVLGAEGLPFEQ